MNPDLCVSPHQTLPPSPWRRPPHHPLQHRRLRQRLHPPPPAGRAGVLSGPLEGRGPRRPRQTQQVLHGPELRLGPLPSAPHPPLPVPVGRGELPPVPFHRALLLPPVPPSSLALHRLLVTPQQPRSPVRKDAGPPLYQGQNSRANFQPRPAHTCCFVSAG